MQHSPLTGVLWVGQSSATKLETVLPLFFYARQIPSATLRLTHFGWYQMLPVPWDATLSSLQSWFGRRRLSPAMLRNSWFPFKRTSGLLGVKAREQFKEPRAGSKRELRSIVLSSDSIVALHLFCRKNSC